MDVAAKTKIVLCLEYYLFVVINAREGEPGSSVSIVPGYGLDDRAIEVRSLAEAKGFFL
jgi:hypothetical protein